MSKPRLDFVSNRGATKKFMRRAEQAGVARINKVRNGMLDRLKDFTVIKYQGLDGVVKYNYPELNRDTEEFNSLWLSLFAKELLTKDEKIKVGSGALEQDALWLDKSMADAYDHAVDTSRKRSNRKSKLPPAPLFRRKALENDAHLELATKLFNRNFDALENIRLGEAEKLRTALAKSALNGDSIDVITKKIRKQIDLTKWRVRRIARTEIANAQVESIVNDGEILKRQLQREPVYEYISSLLPTTAPNHRARHGKRFTAEAISLLFTRPNCLCTPALDLSWTGEVLGAAEAAAYAD